MKNDSLKIIEIFRSIQGESSRAGRPCCFIRLAGCNLSCAWCDTRYSFEEGGREAPVPMLVEAVRAYGTNLVEITGGEPLLQPATPALAAALLAAGFEVLLETNGSMDISVLPAAVSRIMDLKTPSSGMAAYNRIENFVHLRRGDEIKFVIADRADYEWTLAMIAAPEYPGARVETLLSPIFGRMEPATLAGWMLADGVRGRLNLQLHRFIWPGVDRGV